MTVRVRGDVPSLRTARFVHAFERSLRALSNDSERNDFRVLHYSLQGDHAHFVVEAKDRFALGRGMKAVGIRMAWIVRRVFGRAGGVLDGRYHHRVLKTPRQVRNAIAYTLLNARKHLAERLRKAKGASDRKREALPPTPVDRASSGRWFTGWARAPERASDDPPVADARTWLAAVGWRRHRLLDPSEVPGRA